MKTTILLSTIGLMATTASAALWGWIDTEFTFKTGYGLTGDEVGPASMDATTQCVTSAAGIKSVAISTIFDPFNTEYCIQGYDVESCDQHKDIVGMSWDTAKMTPSHYDFNKDLDIKAAIVVKGPCPTKE